MISRKCGPWQDAAVRRQFSSLNLPLFGNLLIERLGIRARRDFLQRVKQGDLFLDDASQPLARYRGPTASHLTACWFNSELSRPSRMRSPLMPFPDFDALVTGISGNLAQTRFSLRIAFKVLS